MNSLPRVRPGLLRHQLDRQVLIYDARDDRVHLLDTTTGHVFELLEEGGRGREGIVAELATRMNAGESDSLLQLSLDELRKADLLDDVSAPVAPLTEINRRDLLRKVGMAGAAALLIPAIATLTATSAYAQASCLPLDHLCDPNLIPCCTPNTCQDVDPGTEVGTCQAP
ncbi:MAG TPA: twin-arginine translocation signal domain-containing protein [Gemmatimonadaceae bacterium]|nr:twin-arginine translocation signal domain-containing protein [Gemmatimonadaceae bacterium]